MKTTKTLGYGFGIIIIIAILVFIALLSQKKYVRVDLTSVKEHSLTDKSKLILKKLTQDVELIGFTREGFQEYSELKMLFSAYEYESKKVKTRLVDPIRYPALAQKYNIKQFNAVVVEGYGRHQLVKFPQEEEITNAINRLVEGKAKKVAWIIGHGERSFKDEKEPGFSALKELMEYDNFELEEMNLLHKDIPEETALVIIAGPEQDFLPEEVSVLRSYLNRGGNVMLFLEPLHDAGLKGFLKEYGLIIERDVVVDKFSKAQGGDFLLPIVVSYNPHEITKDFRVATIYRTARSVKASDRNGDPRMDIKELALTSEDSWAETDVETLFKGQTKLDEADKKGPICLFALVELNPPVLNEGKTPEITGPGKLALFGDVDFATNQLLALGGNKQLVLNTISYMCQKLDFINIKREHKPIQPLLLTNKQKNIIFWFPIVLVPLVVLIIGSIVWYRRRAK